MTDLDPKSISSQPIDPLVSNYITVNFHRFQRN